jgi:hypothetical protein
MFAYSPFFKPIFWIAMGLAFVLAFAGAVVWAQDLGLQMTWWKWALSALWYGIVSVGVAASFTLIGEKEPRAGWYFLGMSVIAAIILGVGLWLVL